MARNMIGVKMAQDQIRKIQCRDARLMQPQHWIAGIIDHHHTPALLNDKMGVLAL